MPRAMMLALVFAALGLFSLHPFCDFVFSTTAHGDAAPAVAAMHGIAQDSDPAMTTSGACCEVVKDGTLVKPAEPLISWTPSGAPGAALLASSGLLLFARSRDPAKWLLAVATNRSFYARSARILR